MCNESGTQNTTFISQSQQNNYMRMSKCDDNNYPEAEMILC